jgi:hypothetical protein
MDEPRDARRAERGQVLVIAAVGMIAFIAMVGLVLDGGATFGQRRAEQKAADLAALAGANDYLLHADVGSAQAVAEGVAKQNGYDPALVTVAVSVTPYHPTGGTVKVDITAYHENSFTPIVGIGGWDVGVSATAVAGIPTGGAGVGPIIFSVNDFQTNGQPDPEFTFEGCPAGGCPFGTVNGDAPAIGGHDLAWTNYGTGNVDTNQVSQIISGEMVIGRTITLNNYIGQHNNGFHNALFQDVNTYLAGKDVLVPVTTEQAPGIPDGPASCGLGAPAGGGCFQGWAIFHVVQAVGGNDKHIYGYFVSQKFVPGGTVEDCTSDCPRSFGAYVLKLVE